MKEDERNAYLKESIKKLSRMIDEGISGGSFEELLATGEIKQELKRVSKELKIPQKEIVRELRKNFPGSDFPMPKVDGGLPVQTMHIEGDIERVVRFR
jgi:hypothetical protein